MKSPKHTLIAGATNNPERYAYLAAERLVAAGHPISMVGLKEGEVFSQPILKLADQPQIANVDTVTLYVGPKNQPDWEDYLISLKPKRIIFNPGTENPDFAKKAEENGIEALFACNLVMLASNTY